MKRNLLILTPIILLLSVTVSSAQKITMDIQGGYGTEMEKGAAGLGFEFFVIDQLAFAPNFNFYLPSDTYNFGGTKVTVNYWEINTDMHFYAVKSDGLSLYFLAGVNIFFAKAKAGSQKDSDNEAGANLGVGINIGPGLPFLEAKYETIFEGQFFIGGGFRFPIK